MEQPALLSIVIEPNSEADHEKLRRGLAGLISDGVAFRAAPDRNTGGVVLGVSTEQQLETIVDRLHREFGVEASVGRPQIAYKETLRRPADGEMKYARQVAGRGEYGHVKLQVAPGAPGSGAVIENDIVGGTIPSQFIASVTQG